MWPDAARGLRIEDIRGPTRIDVVARVLSPDLVRSPLSGRTAAFVWIEALEKASDAGGESTSLGTIVVGDVVSLEVAVDGGGSVLVDVLPRRAELRLLWNAPALPVAHAVAEVVPLLARAKGRGVLCQRERIFLSGERLRLSAVVERAYRSDPVRLVVRDDIAPVMLDEVLDDRVL